MIIMRNRAQCQRCLEILESKSDHDLNTCQCGNLTIDGGHTHLSRTCRDRAGYLDLSDIRTEPCGVLSKADVDESHLHSGTFHQIEATVHDMQYRYPDLFEGFIRSALKAWNAPITRHEDIERIIEEHKQRTSALRRVKDQEQE